MGATPSRHRSEAGAALVLVLAVTTFVSVVVAALLSFTSTGTTVTALAVQDRDATYVATSAIEAAIQYTRSQQWIRPGDVDPGTPETELCPPTRLTLRNRTAVVTCAFSSTREELDRRITFEARVDGAVRSRARVTFRFAPDLPVEITTWWTA